MANFFGYAGGCSETRPDVWQEDGTVSVAADGYHLSATNSFGMVTAVIVKSVVRTGVGAFTLTLSQPVATLLSFDVKTLIPSGSPAFAGVQLLSTTIGQAGVMNPVITFVVNVAGTPTDLAVGSSLLFSLRVATT